MIAVTLSARDSVASLPQDLPLGRRDVILIVASAGGIPALKTISAALPPALPASVAIVLHRTPRRDELLGPVLQRSTRLRVRAVERGDKLESGVVHLAPSNRHLIVHADRSLELMDGRRISRVRSSANPLFQSAAQSLVDRVIAVVLTGTGRNGAASVQYVKDAGGVVIVQDRAT